DHVRGGARRRARGRRGGRGAHDPRPGRGTRRPPRGPGLNLEALVFDFDGLILDTEWAEYVAVLEAYAAYGHRLEIAEWQARVGTVGSSWLDEMEERVGRPIDRDVVGPARRARRRALLADSDPLPGVVDLIEAAHAAGLGLAVASSA